MADLIIARRAQARWRCSTRWARRQRTDLSDLDALVVLRRLSATENGHSEEPGFEQRFADWFYREASRRRFWLVTDDDVPVASANLLLFDRMPTPGRPAGGWGYLGNMYVVPSHRDRGVGSLVLGAIINYADALELQRIVLNPSPRAVPFTDEPGSFPPAS